MRMMIGMVLVGSLCVAEEIPLDGALHAQLAQARVQVKQEERGIGIQYISPVTDAVMITQGFLYGAIGAGIGALAEWGIVEAAAKPLRRNAERLSAVVPAGYVENRLQSKLAALLNAHRESEQSTGTPSAPDGVRPESSPVHETPDLNLSVELDVALSFDMRSVVILADATIPVEVPPVTQPAKRKLTYSKHSSPKPPKPPPPRYRNHFEYYSHRLDPAPELTRAEVAARVEAVRARYAGQRLSDAARIRMRDEITQARKPLSAQQRADYLLAQWLDGERARLRTEIDNGIDELARLLALDLRGAFKADIPKNTQRAVVETHLTREVLKFPAGKNRGGLVSLPLYYEPPLESTIVYAPKKDKD